MHLLIDLSLLTLTTLLLEHRGVKFSEVHRLETDTGETWGRGDGISLKGKTYWTEKGILLGVHMLHDGDVVVHYEIVNFYVPRMGIQACWYRPCTNGVSGSGQTFSLEIKFWVVYF